MSNNNKDDNVIQMFGKRDTTNVLKVNTSTGKVETNETRHLENDFGSRLARIRHSLKRINALVVELKKQGDDYDNNQK